MITAASDFETSSGKTDKKRCANSDFGNFAVEFVTFFTDRHRKPRKMKLISDNFLLGDQ